MTYDWDCPVAEGVGNAPTMWTKVKSPHGLAYKNIFDSTVPRTCNEPTGAPLIDIPSLQNSDKWRTSNRAFTMRREARDAREEALRATRSASSLRRAREAEDSSKGDASSPSSPADPEVLAAEASAKAATERSEEMQRASESGDFAWGPLTKELDYTADEMESMPNTIARRVRDSPQKVSLSMRPPPPPPPPGARTPGDAYPFPSRTR